MRRLLENATRRGLGRLVIVALPLLTVLAALGGVLVDAVGPAVAIALALGLVGAALVLAMVSVRVRALAVRVDRAVERGLGDDRGLDDRGAWRELYDAIDRMAASMRTQAGQIVDERDRSQRLLEELPSAVLLLEHGRVIYVNRAARELFGMTSTAIAVDFAGLGFDVLAGAVDEVVATGRPIDLEFDRDGRMLTARASAVDHQVLLVIRDITGVRRLDAVRRDFVVNASHELKTPVAGIQALAESLDLALRHNPERATRMVTRIEQEAGRLARLVRDLLDLARLEEPDSAQPRRRINVAEVVRGQLERLRPLATERGISVDADLSTSSAVIAVPEDIRAIVANLLENAVRYNRDGGTVTVRLTREDDRVTLDVTDTGDGIPEHARERVFERFYRVDKARSRAAGGTGLGLSLVRHAAERHGGTVTLRSEVGVGSTFRVQLPVV